MEIYLVGGAVRDELLGRPVEERDWVVVGGTAEELLQRGYRQVGRDFPVFLHPKSSEQYALARTERKTAPGHKGFAVLADREVSLEADLARRDLTVNAMAKSSDGRLIDPFNGQRDLAQRLLRHVGEAFREDPLRVFRVARFAAELQGFSVHQSTLALMADMAASLKELPAERIWAEFHKALRAVAPQRFVDVLRDAGCIDHWLPELDGVQFETRPNSARARYGALGWVLGESAVRSLSARLKVPIEYSELSRAIARHGKLLVEWRTVASERLYAAAKSLGALHHSPLSRRAFRLVGVLAQIPMRELEELMARAVSEVHAGLYVNEGLSGPALGRRIERGRIEYLARHRSVE